MAVKNSFTPMEKSLISPFQKALGAAERIRDRIDWWVSKTPKSQRPKVRMKELQEFSHFIETFISEMHEVKGKELSQHASDVMTTAAFETQMNFQHLYEAERERSKKLSALLLKTGTLSSGEMLEEIERLDKQMFDRFMANASKGQG